MRPTKSFGRAVELAYVLLVNSPFGAPVLALDDPNLFVLSANKVTSQVFELFLNSMIFDLEAILFVEKSNVALIVTTDLPRSLASLPITI